MVKFDGEVFSIIARYFFRNRINFFVLYGKRNKITILPVNEEERKETGKKALTAVQPKTGGFSGWNQYKYGDMWGKDEYGKKDAAKSIYRWFFVYKSYSWGMFNLKTVVFCK